MSIEYYRDIDAFVPTCDLCGSELEAEYTWDDAVNAKKQNDWRAFKDDSTGTWTDMCTDCVRLMGTATPNGAKQDFEGVT